MWTNLLFGCHNCGPKWRKPPIQANTVTNQNQLSNDLPVYTGNQSIWTMSNLLHQFTCGLLLFFFKQKWTQASLVSLRGPAVEADSLRSERREPSLSPICCRSPGGDERCWFWHLFLVPTNKSCLFFADVLAQDLAGELEKKKKIEGKKTAPGLEEDIVCMCTEAQGLWPAA